jgi:hypothetical protein
MAVVALAAGAAVVLRVPARWWSGPAVAAAPDPKRYAVLSGDLERLRGELGARHAAAATPEEAAAVLGEARTLLQTALPEMMRCWLGTPWDFNGTATRPGGGKIACGYFVTTVLRDAGFKIDRVRLAQQPSQTILATFVPRASMTLMVGASYQNFRARVATLEPGIYIVGLDNHVAFLVLGRDASFRFIHASGARPQCVVDQPAEDAGVLQRSTYRVLGNLTAQPEVLRRWLAATPLTPHG